MNIAVVFMIRRAHLPHAGLWGFHLLFLTVPFFLKTSWPHDFFYLPFAQAFLAWQLLGTNARQRPAGPMVLLVLSAVLSNIFSFYLLDNFALYGAVGSLFWANLCLLIATYNVLLPSALRMFRRQEARAGMNPSAP